MNSKKGQQLLETAAESPALFKRVRSDSLFWATKCAAELYFRERSPERLTTAMNLARQRIDEGPVPPDKVQLLAKLFGFGGEPFTGWLLAEQTLLENPGSPAAQTVVVQLAVEAGLPVRAIDVADTYLKNNPDDATIRDLRETAISRLKQYSTVPSEQASEAKDEDSMD